MKIHTDVIRVYKDVHTWVGVISGLALFIAFYAGAITMFETPLQRWASPPVELAAPPLEDAPRLIEATIAAHPAAAHYYQIISEPSPEAPARMIWRAGRRDDATFYASSFAEDGSLQVIRHEPAKVAQFIDVLHQQVGLPFDHEVAMPITGAIALMYGLALVSGVIILLPTLAQDLFAMRFGKNLKRMWLDVHNVLGVLSLPFHIIMALTAVVFAFHDQFYDVQNHINYDDQLSAMFSLDKPQQMAPPPGASALSPAQLIARVSEQAPTFKVSALEYSMRDGVRGIRVIGSDPRYGHRAPTYGFANLDPYTGEIISTDYFPGRQDGWFATVTGFFTLHFGSFGGASVRWGYFLLGLGGAFLFYSGNLLWIESRRKIEKRGGPTEQRRSAHVMANLTIGVTAGCIAGVSLTIAAAKWLPGRVENVGAWHTGVYYTAFLAALAWAFLRGAARASRELLIACAIATLAIPLSSFCAALGVPPAWNHGGGSLLIDITALVGAAVFWRLASIAHARAVAGRRDSVWSSAAHSNETLTCSNLS